MVKLYCLPVLPPSYLNNIRRLLRIGCNGERSMGRTTALARAKIWVKREGSSTMRPLSRVPCPYSQPVLLRTHIEPAGSYAARIPRCPPKGPGGCPFTGRATASHGQRSGVAVELQRRGPIRTKNIVRGLRRRLPARTVGIRSDHIAVYSPSMTENRPDSPGLCRMCRATNPLLDRIRQAETAITASTISLIRWPRAGLVVSHVHRAG